MERIAEQDRFRQISRVLWIVLILNFGVAAAKLFCGWLTNSASIMADGYHSFSDGSSNVIGLLGIWMASRPRDERHPYGHAKYESLASAGIALLLFLVCFNVLSDSIERFSHPVQPEIDTASFLVLAITLLVNIVVMLYERNKGRLLQSQILISDSLHTASDIFTTSSVIIGLLVIRAGYPIVDPAIACLISIFIGYAGISILKTSFKILVDAAAVDKEQIRSIAMAINGIEHCHKIRSRGWEGYIHVDMHCHIKRHMSLDEAHKIAHLVEDKIKENIHGIKDVTIHIEPYRDK
ncbi:MAG: cation diffusion facilitator family transporter [Desulfobacteraceae bacterium]|nr:cation diffusion facilitator family transporter [Pseudomonadota bacterium]MBU4463070.1 cation diffusion facilitator family transporter [Pseudomonadota bacterium]MCG2754411.1 cation diffusion facilitator family transporter [Desulfobacteraceae bacterium]